MRGRLLIGAVAILTVTAVIRGGDAARPAGESLFAQGKQLVEQGKDGRAAFRQAMEAFALAPSRSSAAGALNLGNAAFLADELPVAIRAFRQGLAAAPHDRRLREHLAYARTQVQYPPGSERGRPEPEFWPIWLPRVHWATCFTIGAVAYGLAWLLIGAFVCQRRKRQLSIALILLMLAAGAGYGCHLLAQQHQRHIAMPPVVVRSDRVALRTGNGPSYPQHPDLPTLARGMEARLLSERGGWLRIQFASGDAGWVRAEDVLQ